MGAACAWQSQVGGVGMSEPAGRGGVTTREVGNFGRLGGVASGLGEGVLVEAQNLGVKYLIPFRFLKFFFFFHRVWKMIKLVLVVLKSDQISFFFDR
jgi:hypothetical protein